jgi:actin-related protein 6
MPCSAPRQAVGVVVDNGAGSLKAGKFSLARLALALADAAVPEPLVASNAVARPGGLATTGKVGSSRRPPGMLVAAEIDSAPDFTSMSFRRPHERGYLARWDLERDIWVSVFSADMGLALAELAEVSLLVTEPVAAPTHMRRAMDELVFETFGFGEYTAALPSRLAPASPGLFKCGTKPVTGRTALVLDSGFSFTHAVPIVGGSELKSSVRRLNLGGKALTNHLKELVSFRSWNMMDETAVVNAVKERTCFVSRDFAGELQACKGSKYCAIRQEYVLPDLSRGGVDPLGHVRKLSEELDGTEQILEMNNERISVPELLFHPSDVGMDQAGVAELIFQAVEASPIQYRATLYDNIILSGGNCRLHGFYERLLSELRPLVSDKYRISLSMDDDPMYTAYKGGVHAMKSSGSVPLSYVSKAEYEEHGSRITSLHFSTASDVEQGTSS